MKRLVVEFYPPLKSGDPAPYEPTSVHGMPLDRRDQILRRDFAITMMKLHPGKDLSFELDEPGRAIINNPSKNTREIVHGIPWVSHSYELAQ